MTAGDNSGIVSTGANAINIQYLAPSALVRTQYHRQVERIAPPSLVGRKAELAELAAFCTSSAGYAWWRAKAWSGKSALMSWFVLHPPAGVRIVPFFITARLAAQNDRNAFVENVLEQLLALLGESTPALLTEHTREAHLLGLLDRAARTCTARGEHFVLLVDGLDEDRGVDEHSIAALLPLSPSPGMHVLVAGRPNPPIPGDVPSHHPLRDPAIVHPLSPSPRARALRVEMEKDLKRLLRDTDSRDLLGLVTAAGGGLSAADLVSLTGQLRWEIDDRLQTVAGRSFAIRDPYYSQDAPAAYLLAHEDLQATALEMFGPARLSACRDRLRTWAEGYRARDWPADTPEYLLRGYFRMLTTTENVPELLSCATDSHRQHRLLVLTGGDASALTEIRSAMDLLAAQDDPDLVALTRLALHRDNLASRNLLVPAEVPATWASLGHVDRAESIADSMPDGGDRAEALARTAEVLIAAGDRGRGADLLRRAEEAIGSELIPGVKVSALTAVASVLAMMGEADRAEAMIATISWPNEWAKAMQTVIAAVAATGAVGRAEGMVKSIDNPYHRAKAWSCVVTTPGTTAESRRIADVIGQLRDLVRTNAIQDLRNQVDALTSMVIALTEAGITHHVDDLLRHAEEICEEIDDVVGYSKRFLAEAWTAVGDLDRAATFACAVDDTHERVLALVALARGLIAARHMDRAGEVLGHAHEVAQSITNTELKPDALASMAEGFARIGDVDQAIRLASTISDRWLSSTTLARVAGIVAAAGESETAAAVLVRTEGTARAEEINHAWVVALVAECLAEADQTGPALQASDRAEDIARTTADGRLETSLVCSLAATAAQCGDLQRVHRLRASITGPQHRVDLWTAVAKGFATKGMGAQAIDALDQAGPIAFSVRHRGSLYSTLAAVVRELAGHGDLDRAELAANHADPDHRSGLLDIAVKAAAESADADRAAGISGQVERIVESSAVARGENALPALVEVLALTGELGRAEQIVESFHDDGHRDSAQAALARAAAATGNLERAEEIINNAVGLHSRGAISVRVADAAAAAGHVDRAVAIALAVTTPYHRAKALLMVAQAVAAAGDSQRAQHIAHLITDQTYRGEALLKVLRAQAAPVDGKKMAEVLTLTDWRSAVPEVVASTPGALEAIFGELELVYGRSAEVLGGVEQQ
jgi:hypothetical protein